MNVCAEDGPQTIVTLGDFNQPGCLIYGIGNVGRQDDGLGWAFVDWLEETGQCPQAELMRHYQLHLEDADLISHKQRVLFVDASKAPDLENFRLESMAPKMDFSFASHALSVPSVMATCRQCFGRLPETYLLSIRGYERELEEGITPLARRNLDAAMTFLADLPVLNEPI